MTGKTTPGIEWKVNDINTRLLTVHVVTQRMDCIKSVWLSKCHTDWCYKCKFYIFVIPTNCTCPLIIFCDITVISSTFRPTQAIFREKTNTKEYIFDMKCHRGCSFIPLACAECDDSVPFSGASSIPLCYVPFPAILLRQLFFHPPSPHLAIYFLVYLSILLFPNSYIIPFWEFLFSSIFCTCLAIKNGTP